MFGQFTHFDSIGNAVMVDVSSKKSSCRIAVAKGAITVNEQILLAIKTGTSQKGDVLAVARLAGITGAKKTSEIIPLSHPLSLDSCTVDFTVEEEKRQVEATCTVKLTGKTGAEMEALTGVSIALLTIYDMCKAMDLGMAISNIWLMEKSGGVHGHYIRKQE
jgi:cyclic pyranopterin phosphate synthase